MNLPRITALYIKRSVDQTRGKWVARGFNLAVVFLTPRYLSPKYPALKFRS